MTKTDLEPLFNKLACQFGATVVLGDTPGFEILKFLLVFFTVLQCHSEIEAYVAEEMFYLNQEIHALSNVISKVENELQETMKFAGQ